MTNFKKLPILTLFAISAGSAANEAAFPLEEMFIAGQQDSVQSGLGSRLNLDLKEIPATIDVLNGNAIRNRLDLSVLDAVTRSASFVGAGNPGNGGTSITARGFTGQDAVAKLYDGNQYFTLAGTNTFPFDTWAVERIEILKGPASVLYGQGGVAGAINIIPKAPSEEFGIDVRLTAGEDRERFVGAGITGEIVPDLTGRVDFSKRESDNWVNNGESETDMLALALQWQVSEDFSLTFRHDAGDQSPMRYFGIPVVDGDFNEDWERLNFNVEDSRVRYQDDLTRLISDWEISDTLSMKAEIFSLESDRYWQTVETYSFDAESGLVQRGDPLIIRHQIEQLGFRANFVFESSIASMPWQSSFGVEYTDIEMTYTSNFNPTHPNRVDWGGDVDTVDPNNLMLGAWSDITDSVAATDQVSDAEQLAFFAESQLKLTDQFALVAGLRIDSIDTDYERLTYTELGTVDDSVEGGVSQKIDPLMFRVGAVYDLNENTALYGQYSTGETHPNGGDVLRVRSNYRESDTVEVEQFEVGLKQYLIEGRLSWSLSLFDITKNNLLIDDPDSADPTDRVSIPEQRSRGGEVGLQYALADSLTGYANLSVVDAERDTGSGSISTPYVPEKTFNSGLLYRPVEFIQLGADIRYVDARPFEDTPQSSYTVLDLSLAWIISEDMRVSMNAINVSDELYASSDHWTGRQWSVAKPRTLSLTVDLGF